uniref:hypothetical protein n=1 Tax=Variovorax sp. BK018 TaxID=3450241 RepID=UPI00403A660D
MSARKPASGKAPEMSPVNIERNRAVGQDSPTEASRLGREANKRQGYRARQTSAPMPASTPRPASLWRLGIPTTAAVRRAARAAEAATPGTAVQAMAPGERVVVSSGRFGESLAAIRRRTHVVPFPRVQAIPAVEVGGRVADARPNESQRMRRLQQIQRSPKTKGSPLAAAHFFDFPNVEYSACWQ